MLGPIVYAHTQIGYDDLIASAGGCLVLVVAALAVQARGNPQNLPRATIRGVFAFATASLLAFGFTFSRMTVSVRDDTLSWNFAFGLLQHHVPLSTIMATSVLPNTVSDGFGIHHTSSGTLYNVGGGSSVQIKLRDGSELRLGTDQPDSLLAAIRASALALPQ